MPAIGRPACGCGPLQRRRRPSSSPGTRRCPRPRLGEPCPPSYVDYYGWLGRGAVPGCQAKRRRLPLPRPQRPCAQEPRRSCPSPADGWWRAAQTRPTRGEGTHAGVTIGRGHWEISTEVGVRRAEAVGGRPGMPSTIGCRVSGRAATSARGGGSLGVIGGAGVSCAFAPATVHTQLLLDFEKVAAQRSPPTTCVLLPVVPPW